MEDAFGVASGDASPEAEAGDRAALAKARAAMAQLPTKLREVLVLRAIEGMSQAEAAEALGVTEKTVETRLYRARAQLKATVAGTNDGEKT